MAVAVDILLLVALFSDNIHTETIQGAGEFHNFILDKRADFCLISRWTSGETKLLWNSSAFYHISGMNVSHSGQYQEQCWRQGNVTHERNTTLLVCDMKRRPEIVFLVVGTTVELTCDGAGPNQSVGWFLEIPNHKTQNWEFVLVDDETSSAQTLQLANNKSTLLVTDNGPSVVRYYCLERNQQSCDLLKYYIVDFLTEFIQRSVGESLELNCSHVSGNQTHVWRILYSMMDTEVETHDYTLTFPSLTSNHSGRYICDHSVLNDEVYLLLVCPESDPPAEVFFTGGENLTLQCGDWKETDDVLWLMKSNRTEGKVLHVRVDQKYDKMYHSHMNLVILNVSLEDSGEFWCVVMKDLQCMFTSKTLVMFRGPGVDHHQVRSGLLTVLMMMCVVVIVTVVLRTRIRGQLPVPVEDLEMSELSPAI